MWAYETSFYQIYTLGFCGAPFENDGELQHRILKVLDWIPHLKKLGVGAVLFNPVFESDTHGYNTRDYKKIDVRLGTNEDFKKVCDALHKEGIKIVLDAVFNHAGRGFWGFKDVLEKRWDSRYKDWFNISFEGNSNYNDGLWYEGWEGNYDLVKLNLRNPAVADYLLESAKFWVDEFGVDGLRLDVAYCLDPEFIKRLRRESAGWKEDFFLMGEMIGGDYNRIMGDELCHSATNYECYKGMHSALNSMNLFEIVHSLLRQFGPENWTLYRGKHLLSFVDNHDVSRIASILQRPEHLKLIYTLMFGMPGIPTIYYGSEWATKADKSQGDPALRPCFDKPEWTELTDTIAALCKAKNSCKALSYGDFKSLVLTNRQCIFERECDGDRALVVINADENHFHADFNARAGRGIDLITGSAIDFGGGLDIPAYTGYIIGNLD
ncbi:alpha-amylase family glycosyl hydrolase [Butyrivibrio sp. DSM 10294]|uniref:alpha-amylase family glycosyl hydrolase n=1 Tax=Butyrivibrio sp. DSM 10294 TaxID=2972457 RepID=UPI00234F0982|nr:alpha-amylase family glycosyl hydrolase [Butyrivibrio sp. DSM 10294]MDC7294292.1 alpha-amylase family glycosyl hydrolase [Butyrivibrio sp. DSM 10294]